MKLWLNKIALVSAMQGFQILSIVETVENCISVFDFAMSADDNFTISGKTTGDAGR